MASRSPSIADAEKLLARAEFRVLPTLLEKAVVLVSQHGITCQIAASACGLSKWAVWSGVKAMNKGRTPGVVGRPTALTPTEEASIIQMIINEPKRTTASEPGSWSKLPLICSRPGFQQLRPARATRPQTALRSPRAVRALQAVGDTLL